MAAGAPGHRSRSRALLTAVLLAVVLLLLVHGVAMGVHHVPNAGCATCIVAILAALAVMLVGSLAVSPVFGISIWRPAPVLRGIDTGAIPTRHPPRLGPVLRL